MVPAPVVGGVVVGGVVVVPAPGIVMVLSVIGGVVGGVVVMVLSAAGVIVIVLSAVGASDGVLTEPVAPAVPERLSVVTLPVTAPDAAGVLLIESTGAVVVAPPVAAPSLAGAESVRMVALSLDIDSELLAPIPPASFSTRTPDDTAPVFCAWLVEAAPTVAAMAAATAQLLLLIVI